MTGMNKWTMNMRLSNFVAKADKSVTAVRTKLKDPVNTYESCPNEKRKLPTQFTFSHGVIILNRSNNS